jgi:hypothetical protein
LVGFELPSQLNHHVFRYCAFSFHLPIFLSPDLSILVLCFWNWLLVSHSLQFNRQVLINSYNDDSAVGAEVIKNHGFDTGKNEITLQARIIQDVKLANGLTHLRTTFSSVRL